MMRRGWSVLVGAILVAVLGWGLTALPVPYVALGPGPTIDTLGRSDNGTDIISVSGRRTSSSAGHLNLTTVSVSDQLDLGTAVRLWLGRDTAVVPRELIYPPGRTDQQVDEANKQAFSESQTSAETAALRELGYPVQVVVAGLTENSPSAGTLRAGDLVTAVNGTAVTSRTNLVAQVSAVRPGNSLTVTYQRAGAKGTAQIVAGKGNAGQAIIGVQVEQRQPHPFTVGIQLDKIGGPSAGLMFALGIVDKLTPEDLTGGIYVAGTGEIDDDGRVGPIGGIQQKLIAAKAVGAQVFLTPADNCGDAVPARPDGLRLVKVDSLDGALSALQQLRSGGNPPSC
jgi:PDZ domain-containing protein